MVEVIKDPRAAAWLYFANMIFLVVHEIDSAYWHEWALLGLPGGIQVFLLLHLPLLALVFWGFWRVVSWTRWAKAFSFLLGVAGIVAFSIHMALIAKGASEFRLPTSQAILWGTLLLSVAQMTVAWQCPRPKA
jgi:hypothetical protein